jgi:calcineurin-like phosphoesterase family protein
MTIWFTSDEHYGHANIIGYERRPFANVENMNAELIARHNDVVRSGDTVYHLGDFSLAERFVPEVLPRLVGRHILIAGNHDACHPNRKGGAKKVPMYLAHGFERVELEDVIRLPCDLLVALHHLPYIADDRHGDLYARMCPTPGAEDGLLHGHVHSEWQVRGRMINVGVDVWGYRPVSIDEVLEIARGWA